MPPASHERSDPRTVDDRYLAAGQIPAPRSPGDTPSAGMSDSGLSGVAAARVREASARNTTGAEMYDAQQFSDAVQLFEQALASCRVTLGDSHPDTLRVTGNLGVALVHAGDSRKGIQLIKTTAEARTEVLGPDHPDTLTALNALAVAHRLTGNPDKALETAKRVVLARSRALGSTHPDTLTSRMGLGLALAAAGETANAHRIVDKTLADARETLGVDDDHYLALVDCGFDSGLLQAELS
jgi:tetratricopeptide (TPR) repeat protein